MDRRLKRIEAMFKAAGLRHYVEHDSDWHGSQRVVAYYGASHSIIVAGVNSAATDGGRCFWLETGGDGHYSSWRKAKRWLKNHLR